MATKVFQSFCGFGLWHYFVKFFIVQQYDFEFTEKKNLWKTV